MANSTSANLKLTVQATGENSGTWGQITNTNLLILEQAIGGYDAFNVTNASRALTFTNGAISDGKNEVIKLTGTLAANVNVTIPDSIEKTYTIQDACNHAGYTLTLPASPSTGDEVSFIDQGYDFNTNALTVGRNSSNIANSAADLVVNTQGAGFSLVYSGDATTGWTYREK